jgi:drug/metabolite transporter (DMT)-like permease
MVNGSGWLGIAYSSLFGVVLAYILWNAGIQKIGSGRAAVYQNLSPLTAAVLAVAFLGEIFTPLRIGGAVLILVGIYLVRVLGH